ncbi:serine/threonine-protein kinase [Nannocystis pusilla]|uniref:Serine/threonine protein kinase n=1 Tax=Nannocystis pusilla TaxID=889268 RepID=A0ABS7U2L2_9BACT|nr:serine/threonine-protein kinase [Nannocystis pusilla]MBZ5714694.1 serine/threonine protein kinase [Nannocystis pusilla]
MVKPDPKALVGKTLGGVYRIKRHVAAGGFADLYEGWHEELETPVAVKVRRPADEGASEPGDDPSRNDDYLFAHFKTEAILGFRLRDPHVVRVLDFRLEAKVEYLVMEWLEGKSLQALADGRPMYWRRAVELMAKAADAVAGLHAAGWFHRDIKPDNFMVIGDGEDERVVLIDLGLVRQRPLAAPIVSQLAEPTAWIAHTPGYCAPEVYAQVGQKITTSPFTEASEVFALGVTLYKLITARIPWSGHTPQQQQVEIAGGAPPLPPSEFGIRLPPELELVLLRTLGVDPSQRPDSAQAFARELRRVLAPSKPLPDVATARPPEAVSLDGGIDTADADAQPVAAPAPANRPWLRLAWPLLTFTALLGLTVILWPAPVPTPSRILLGDESPPAPVPAPIEVVQPEAPPADVGVEPPPPPPAPRRHLTLGDRLRRCPDAPSGMVQFEIRDRRLVKVDLEPLQRNDPWHRCAARILQGEPDGLRPMNL